jgi:hypothetical protein
MNQKPRGRSSSSEQIIRDIKRKTRKQYSAEEKIRIVLDGLRGEDSIAKLPSSPRLVDLTDPNIIYIGQATTRLKTRLSQFENAATKGVGNHSGGVSFHKKYGALPKKSIQRWLRVAAISVIGDQQIRSAYIKYLERSYLYKFVLMNDGLPLLNKE